VPVIEIAPQGRFGNVDGLRQKGLRQIREGNEPAFADQIQNPLSAFLD
jgi:hypothetical protein